MTFFERLSALWASIRGVPRMVRILFGPPPLDGDLPHIPRENPIEDFRDPKENPIEGFSFAGIYGGVRRFVRFDPENGDAIFTRGDRPNLCREPIDKWRAWMKTATLATK